MDKTETVISVRNLTCGYDETVVVDNVSFDISKGEIFIILGGSGCGKSTLLKNMIGLIPPMSGEVWFGEDELTSAQGQKRHSIIRKFGVMYQMGALFGSMSLLQNVMLPLEEFTDLPRTPRRSSPNPSWPWWTWSTPCTRCPPPFPAA